MSKLYSSTKEGVNVLSGKVKAIADNRESMDVTFRKYDITTGKSETLTKTVIGTHIGPEYKVGQSVTAIGYIIGPEKFQLADNAALSHEASAYEVGSLAIVSGYLESAKLNDEKDQDGNQKLKADGTPKKPHFDLKVIVNEDGRDVVHFVKNYNFVSKKDGTTVNNIEDSAKRFAKFESPETTPTYVTIVTQPGQSFQFEKQDGSVYYGVSHMGTRSVDQIFEYQLQKSQTTEKSQPAEQTVAPAKSAPTPQSKDDYNGIPFKTPEEARSTATNESVALDGVSGFDNDFEAEFE